MVLVIGVLGMRMKHEGGHHSALQTLAAQDDSAAIDRIKGRMRSNFDYLNLRIDKVINQVDSKDQELLDQILIQDQSIQSLVNDIALTGSEIDYYEESI